MKQKKTTPDIESDIKNALEHIPEMIAEHIHKQNKHKEKSSKKNIDSLLNKKKRTTSCGDLSL